MIFNLLIGLGLATALPQFPNVNSQLEPIVQTGAVRHGYQLGPVITPPIAPAIRVPATAVIRPPAMVFVQAAPTLSVNPPIAVPTYYN